MAKKVKNIKHKEAVARKDSAEKEMNKLGLTLSGDMVSIGFIFEDLIVSHKNYLALSNLNRFCKMYAGVDVCIFDQSIIPPCIQPSFPIFTISDLFRWGNNSLVSTSISTTLDALSTHVPIIYHYAFDPEFIDQQWRSSVELRRAYCDPRIRLLARHQDHKLLFEEEFNVKVYSVIPDFEIEPLIKLVIEGCK